MKRFTRRLTPCFDQSTEPVIVTVTTPPTPEPEPTPDNQAFLLGQLTTQVQQITETINTISTRLESLEMSERWTREDLTALYREISTVQETATKQVEAIATAAVEAIEELQEDGALEQEESSESLTPEGLPEIPPAAQAPEEIQQQETPGDNRKGFWSLKNWL